MEEDSKQRLEYIYKEYMRLNDKAEELIGSTIDDFKLFGAVGAIIVIWQPISELILSTNSNLNASLVLFLGFLSLLAILGIIGLQNLFKQAYAWYFIHNLQAYEKEIRKELNESKDSNVFKFNIGKEESRFVISYRLTFRTLFICFALAVSIIPSIVLFFSNVLLAAIYFSLSLFGFFVVYVPILRRTLNQYSDRRYL
ncbi:MAG: hypothetical protein AAF921_11680 [Cyanobacteria bacterium P01_D01_bin.44]